MIVLVIIASGVVGVLGGWAAGVATACYAVEDGWTLIIPLGASGAVIGGVLGAVVGVLVF